MIVCCGEALIDMVQCRGINDVTGYQPIEGGAIFNTAIGLGRLGFDAAIVAGISYDMFGQKLVDALLASKVNTDLLIRSNQPTTLAFVRLIDGHAHYTFYDENTAGRSFQLEAIPVLPEAASCLYFGGISLIAEPAADAFCALAEAESRDRVIMLDPNIRPSFIMDEKAYRTRMNSMIAIADIIKVSDEDLDWLVPGGADVAEKVIRLRQPANQLIIVTRGSNSCLAFGAGGLLLEQEVEKSVVVDTVGAGDTFNSGLLASLSEQNCLSKQGVASLQVAQVAKALAYGAKVAAVTVSRAGADAPWSWEL